MDVQTQGANQVLHRSTQALGMHECIELCLRTHQECSESFQYCLQTGGDHIDPHHLKLMQSSIEICYTSARFMMLQSPYHQVMCEICAQICTACAKSCEELHDDALAECIALCVSCADSCQKMAGPKS